MPSFSNDSPVWFITGCSTGFGREVAQQVLARGARAVLTARDKARIADLAEGHAERSLVLDLDVTDPVQISAAVQATQARFGRIDVLVNNAGYGYQAAVEEGDDREIRAMFDTNVFGLFAVTRAVLPGMRERRAGHVMNITSVAGLVGMALTLSPKHDRGALSFFELGREESSTRGTVWVGAFAFAAQCAQAGCPPCTGRSG